MEMSVKALRERADAGELTEDDHKFLKDREGLGVYDAIRNSADEPVFDDSEDEDEEGYGSWSKQELKDELAKRELPTSGNMADLIERLEESDAASEGEDEDEEDED